MKSKVMGTLWLTSAGSFVSGLLLPWFICSAPELIHAEEGPAGIYTVEGRLHCELPHGRELQETFVVAVSNRTWSIRIRIPERPAFEWFDQVYDGEVLSSVTRFASNAAPGQSNGSRRKALHNDTLVTVERADVADSRIGTYAGPLWLAFASHHSFADEREGLLPLVWYVSDRLRSQGFRIPAVWRRNAEAPHLPEEVAYFFDEEAFAAAQGLPPRQGRGTNDAGRKRLWVSYRAGPFTNIGGTHLPLSFRFELYRPGAREAGRAPTYSVEGQVTAARAGASGEETKGALGKLTFVEDRRLARDAPLTYVVTGRALPSISSPAVLRMHAAIKQISHAQRTSHHKRRTAICILLTLALVGPPGVLIARRLWRHRRSRSRMRGPISTG